MVRTLSRPTMIRLLCGSTICRTCLTLKRLQSIFAKQVLSRRQLTWLVLTRSETRSMISPPPEAPVTILVIPRGKLVSISASIRRILALLRTTVSAQRLRLRLNIPLKERENGLRFKLRRSVVYKARTWLLLLYLGSFKKMLLETCCITLQILSERPKWSRLVLRKAKQAALSRPTSSRCRNLPALTKL